MFSTKTYILIFSLCLSIAQYEATGDCPELPVFGPDEPIEIEFFYVTNEAGDLETNLCAVIEQFGGLLNVKYRMGALAQVLEDGTLDCGPSGCIPDQEIACTSMLDPSFDDCGPIPELDPIAFDECLLNYESDGILIENGQLRIDYGIPEDGLPALVFNGFYDPCAPIGSPEEIFEYVCALYMYEALPCIPPEV